MDNIATKKHTAQGRFVVAFVQASKVVFEVQNKIPRVNSGKGDSGDDY
jgi:hypothetical protein